MIVMHQTSGASGVCWSKLTILVVLHKQKHAVISMLVRLRILVDDSVYMLPLNGLDIPEMWGIPH